MPSNPTPDEMRLALAQQNRVAVPNRPGRTMPADQAKLSYALTHGLAPMLYGAAKGTVASIPGVVGDVNELLRDYAVPYLPTGVQQALAKAPAPYTTEQYINMMPKMGGHTENVATKLGSNVVGTIVDPFAVVGAVKRAPAVARSLAETANNKILQGESLIPGVPAQFVNPPVLPIVKPEKGGNWLAGSIEDAVRPLKINRNPIDTTRPITQDAGNAIRYDYPNIDEAYSDYFRGTRQHSMDYADGYYKWMAENYPKEFKELSEGKTPTDHLNRFVDKKLVPYIKNEMATPFDSVRKLAEEKGVSHLPLENNPVVVRDIRRMREEAGFPVEGVAQTPLGRQWENYADESIGKKSAGMMIKQGESDTAFDIAKVRLQVNPWLRDVDPSTNIYSPLSSEQITSNLGFDHVMDELRNAISPNSGLPDNLRLKPESLDKVTLPQAIERVAKINDWRAAEAAKAEKAGMLENLNAAPRLEVPEAKLSFVEKPGMKWVDIPDTTDTKGLNLCTTIGKQGGWCTQGEGLAESYGSGSNRLTALLDAEGRPHAQAKITSTGGDEFPPDITELKPVGNYFESKQALEYERRDPNYRGVVQQGVLDFLNKGDWGRVNDLDQYNIIDARDPSAIRSYVSENYGGDFGMVDARSAQKDFSKNYNGQRFLRFEDFHDQIDNFIPPEEGGIRGMKRGGIVKMRDGGGVSASDSDPSLQFYSRTMDNPDSSKTTESGIVKQFEQDYMKFALQRHQAPARSDIPNAQPPAARTNIYGEYGTPALGGMVSGRVTKLGQAPDTYMGDLSYRTPVGPGMAHLGVQGMQSPQMPARMTGYQAGYGVPLGGNGFAGVNVMQPAQGGKPVFGAQVQYRRQFAKGGAVRSLESNLPKLPKTDYKSIDELMTEISKRHKTAPKKLHDDFVKKHRMTPDTWIKRK